MALVAAAIASGALGFVFERVIIRQVYGAPLRQILITIGALTVIEQLIIVIWGPQAIPLPKPAMLRGSMFIGSSSIETYRLFALCVGLAIALAMHLFLTRTRLGLVVRAGVEDREMIQALGYHIRRVFIGVFMAGTALAGIGGDDVGAVSGRGHQPDRRQHDHPGVHHSDHRRPRFGRRLFHRRDPGRA